MVEHFLKSWPVLWNNVGLGGGLLHRAVAVINSFGRNNASCKDRLGKKSRRVYFKIEILVLNEDFFR
jgi:hypothetical protein